MSCKLVAVSIRWFALVAVLVVVSPSDSLGSRHFSAGFDPRSEYGDVVFGAGSAEGDIWGGEQGTDPTITPIGPVVGEDTPLINTLPGCGKPKPEPVPNGGQALWLYQLAGVLHWLGTVLGFPIL